MNCTIQMRILRFALLSNASFPYNRTLISLCWLSDGRDLPMFIKSFMRISWISLKKWHCRKKCSVVLASMLQEQNGFKVSLELGSDVNKTICVDSTYYRFYYKYHFWKNVLKSILCLEIHFSKNLHIETSQLILKSMNCFLYNTSFNWKIACRYRKFSSK